MKLRNRRERGHAMIELALSAGVMIACLSGTFQFGYTFYVYDQLVTAVGNGARYASGRTYRAASDTDVERGNAAIRNMVVFGNPQPAADAAAITPNLKPENVQVNWIKGENGTPSAVDVSIVHYKLNAVFASFDFTQRPLAEFPYLGRYAPSESEK